MSCLIDGPRNCRPIGICLIVRIDIARTSAGVEDIDEAGAVKLQLFICNLVRFFTGE